MSDEFYMDLALKKAWKFQILTYPNPAVGAVVIDSFGKILSIESHQKASYAHAEILAIFRALQSLNSDFESKFLSEYNAKFSTNFKSCENLGSEFDGNFIYNFILQNHANLLVGAKIFVTLEPCSHFGKTPPCASLIASLGFKECVVGVKDFNKNASGGEEILQNSGVSVKFGVLQSECEKLITPFKKWLNRGKFVIFKVALSANGVASGGIISNLESRAFSHRLREVANLIIIGGNTARIDRPTLDTRLVSSEKNPNVFIFSHQNLESFDPKIPLFGVKNRLVEIGQNLSQKLQNGLIIIEGGKNFMREIVQNMAILKEIDYFLFLHSNEFKNAENLKLNAKFRQIFTAQNGGENYSWCEIL